MVAYNLVRMEGRRFGALAVVRRAPAGKKAALWICQCDCGQQVTLRGDRLRQGRNKTCAKNGHSWRQHLTSGMTKLHPHEYRTWSHMRDRCINKKNDRYTSYGGRGITICKAWDSFEQFFRDMGAKPTREHTIERNNVNGNYEPANCRWATRKEQGRNLQRSIYVEYEGQRMLLMDVVSKLGLNRSVVTGRLKMGWSLTDALSIPVRPKKPNRKNRKAAT